MPTDDEQERDRGLGPSPPDPGLWRDAPSCLVMCASVLGVLLPERALLDRLAALALLLCAALAALHHRRDPAHGPVKVGLVSASAADSVNAGLHDAVLTGGPYFGVLRGAFHAHEALNLVLTAVVPLVAGAVLLDGARWRVFRAGVAAGALALLAALVLGYGAVRDLPPEARAEWLRLRYLGAELAALCASLAVVWRAGKLRLSSETLAEATAKCLTAGGLALLPVGAWGRGLFGSAFAAHQAGLLGLYSVVALVHVWPLRRGRGT